MKNSEKGQDILIVIVIMAAISALSIAFLGYVQNIRTVSQRSYNTTRAMNVAEAGVNKALWCLNHPATCSTPNETNVNFGDGQYTTTVTPSYPDYEILSVGTVAGLQKKVKVTVAKQTTETGAAFFYGVQVGAGGLIMENNSYIDGNVYSDGPITNGPGKNAYITRDVYAACGISQNPVPVQLNTTTEYPFGCKDNCPASDLAQSFKPEVTEIIAKVSLYLKKVGNPGNLTIHICENIGEQPKTTGCTSGQLSSTQITENYGWVDVTFNTSLKLTAGNTYWIVYDAGSDNYNYYKTMKHFNSGYGNGFGIYNASNWNFGSWLAAEGDFAFKIWMCGSVNSISDIIVGCSDTSCSNSDCNDPDKHGHAYAHQIINSWVKCDAYYDSDPDDIQGTTVGRNKYPNQLDPSPANMPVSEAQINQWKTEATVSPDIVGNYVLDGAGATALLGPKKIIGNMTISNGAKLKLTGTVYVTGDITFYQNAEISLDAGYKEKSGLLLADGKIKVQNNCILLGSGTAGSYIMMLTTNNSTDLGAPAIDINNNANTVIFYASQGLVKVANNAHLKEVTAYKLYLSPLASVTYESGLENAKFASGPGGVYKIKSKTWQEIKSP